MMRRRFVEDQGMTQAKQRKATRASIRHTGRMICFDVTWLSMTQTSLSQRHSS